MQAAARGARLGLSPRSEDLVDDKNLLVRFDGGLRRIVVVEVFFVDDHVDVIQFAQFPKLEWGELDLHRPATPKDVHIGDGTRLERPVHVVRDFRRQQVVRVLGQHSRDIESNVSVSDDRDLFRVQRPLARHVGVTVIPRHEIGCSIRTVELDSRDVEVGVANRTRRENHRVIVLLEVVERDVGSEVDVPENANTARVQHIPQRIDDPLDSGVVGGNAISDESVGRGEALKQVD